MSYVGDGAAAEAIAKATARGSSAPGALDTGAGKGAGGSDGLSGRGFVDPRARGFPSLEQRN